MRRLENELFSVSLYKLDCELERRELEDELKNKVVIDKKLLAYLQEYYSVFLKAILDKLPPYRLYNYKIELESNT